MDVLGANRLQRVVCSKRSCGFSTQAQWNMLPQSLPEVHRPFQTWCQHRRWGQEQRQPEKWSPECGQ